MSDEPNYWTTHDRNVFLSVCRRLGHRVSENNGRDVSVGIGGVVAITFEDASHRAYVTYLNVEGHGRVRWLDSGMSEWLDFLGDPRDWICDILRTTEEQA